MSDGWQCTSFQIPQWIVLWGINNIYCHIWALLLAKGLPFFFVFLFYYFYFLFILFFVFFIFFPICLYIYFNLHVYELVLLSFSCSKDTFQTIWTAQCHIKTLGTLECFKPKKFMTQFHCWEINLVILTTQRTPTTVQQNGLSIRLMGKKSIH